MNRIIKIKFKKYRLHLLIWILFISYESAVIGIISGAFGTPLTYAAHYLIIIFLFYLHANWSLPWVLKNSKNIFWKLPLVLILEIGVFLLISFFTDRLLIIYHILPNTKPLTLTFQYTLKTLFRDLYIMGYATGYYYLITYNKEKRKTEELEKQRLNDIIYRQNSEQELTKAQNAFLKAQINPHFLFNTLDFIYHNIISLSPVAADTVIRLAEMMRYAIDSDKMGDFICLGDEIDQVENLLYLNQVRKNHELSFKLQYDKEARHIYLIPLVLLTMVENIFKHGNLSQPEHEVIVRIHLNSNTFFIETDNLINNHTPTARNHKGLRNIEKRLKYAYGNTITFSYNTDDSNHFKVLLGIPLEQLQLHAGPSVPLKDNGTGLLHDYADLKQITG